MGGGFVSTLADFQSRTARIIREETRIRTGKLKLPNQRLSSSTCRFKAITEP